MSHQVFSCLSLKVLRFKMAYKKIAYFVSTLASPSAKGTM